MGYATVMQLIGYFRKIQLIVQQEFFDPFYFM